MSEIDLNKVKEFTDTEVIGKNIVIFDSLPSTNSHLAELYSDSTDEGTVVVADSQTGGKGRKERKWFSPGGCNLYMSSIFIPELHPKYSPVFTYIASLATIDTLKHLNFSPEIKWPNDVLINNKKVSGVLTEMRCAGDRLEYIIVGIGLNVNMTAEVINSALPEESNKITSLYLENGKELNREYVLSNLINNLDRYYLKFCSEGLHSITAQWTTEWGKLNEFVSIDVSGEIIEGTVRKVDSYGYIYIERDDGNLEKVITGDTLFSNPD